MFMHNFSLYSGADTSSSTNAAPVPTSEGASASKPPTPASYYMQSQQGQGQAQQQQQPQAQQQQQPSQQQQAYAGYPSAAAVPVPHRGPHMAYPGQPYGVPTGDNTPPRGSMPPTSIAAGTPAQAGQGQQQYYSSYPPHTPYPGFSVSSSTGTGYTQPFPGHPYPGTFSQGGPLGPAAPAPSQLVQKPSAVPNTTVNRYPAQPNQVYQQWPQ
ncbi:hypothetical protein SK128_008166 [Halocaridina rubra]|uniref:Uncharacterized protein n=1 Tax=Halocaridina rubra TaxID=373956 RepID=A0AAN8WUT5_HALRR